MITATASKTDLTAARQVVARLAARGVDTVFGIPGVHNQALYDALVDEPKIRSVVTRHEQGAAFMADGFARASGGVGVCCLISGPGASNAATALAEAYADSSAVVALVTRYLNSPLERGRRLHDMRDQSAFLRSITKETLTVSRVAAAAEAVDAALTLAREGRPGPVAVELPLEILDERTSEVAQTAQVAAVGTARPRADGAAALVQAGLRPVIVVGGGASDASAEVRELADRLRAPVVCTTAGKGVLPDDHPLCVGPWLRAAGVRDLIAMADPLIMLGTEWSTTDIGEQPYALPDRVLVVNLEDDRRFADKVTCREEVARAVSALLADIPARMDERVEELVARLKAEAREEPRRWLPDAGPYVAAMREALARDAIVTNDMNTLSYAAAELYDCYVPRAFLSPKGYGTLGFALPVAIGARFARPDRQVVAVVGDGGLMFTAEELVTAVRHRLNVPIIVWNNNSYGAIRYTRTAAYGRSVDDDLINPDFVSFAQACGANAARVETPESLAEALSAAVVWEGPTLIEINAGGER